MNVERFKKATGATTIDETSPVWKDWKRKQVTEFLKGLVQRTRELRPHIRVSTTGCMPYVRAYEEAFQDWPSWINKGIVDFTTVMDYSTTPQEYERWITNAKTKTADFKKVNIGLGAYKSTGSREIFEREYRICEASGAGACVVFHYNSLLQNPALSAFFNNPKGH